MTIERTGAKLGRTPSFDSYTYNIATGDRRVTETARQVQTQRTKLQAAERERDLAAAERSRVDEDWLQEVIEAGPPYSSAFYLNFGIVSGNPIEKMRKKHSLGVNLCGLAHFLASESEVPVVFIRGQQQGRNPIYRGFFALLGTAGIDDLYMEERAEVSTEAGARTLSPIGLNLVLHSAVRVASDLHREFEHSYRFSEPMHQQEESVDLVLATVDGPSDRIKAIRYDAPEDEPVRFGLSSMHAGQGFSSLSVGASSCREGLDSFKQFMEDPNVIADLNGLSLVEEAGTELLL